MMYIDDNLNKQYLNDNNLSNNRYNCQKIARHDGNLNTNRVIHDLNMMTIDKNALHDGK